jgi:hypothetical protein
MLLDSNGDHPLPGGESETLECIVGRDLCLFLTVDAGNIPEKKRDAFVEMSVRRAAPFPDPGFGLAWSGAQASVWYWSQSRVQELSSSPWPRRVRFTPEALHVGQPQESVAELLDLENGFEGRVWKQHRLIASRWWPDVPDTSAWTTFARGAGLPPGSMPATLPAPVKAQKWSMGRRASALPIAGFEQYLPRIVLGCGAALLLVCGFELGSIARAGIDIIRAQRAAQSLDAPLARILKARESADTHAAAIGQLLPLRGRQSQLRLMAEVGRVMKGKDWQLRLWQQPTPDRLEVTISAPNLDPKALVSAWETSPLFKDVTPELSRQQNEVTIRATIIGRDEARQ